MLETQRMAECHPDRPHYAKGLCQKCYNRKQHEDDRERRLALMKEWGKENAERKREMDRNWRENNKEYKSEIDRKWREENRDRCYEAKLLKRYGITLTEYDDLLEAQNGVCAVCGKTPEENGKRLFVDHNHTTGMVRGLLCRNCNFLLGFAQDSIYNLSSAIDYLERHGEPPPPNS